MKVKKVLEPDPKAELNIGFFNNCSDEIARLDLAWINIRIHKISSSSFDEFLISISDEETIDEHRQLIETIQQEEGEWGWSESLFAFVPVDMNISVSGNSYKILEKILLIMFPSDCSHKYLLSFVRDANGKFRSNSRSTYDRSPQWWLGASSDSIDDSFLRFDINYIASINDFIKLSWTRINQIEYLSFATSTYISSFSQRNVQMRYVNLCMVLESLIEGTSELNHRICRSCAVVNAETRSQGMIIYKNVSEFYKIRSKIVHGEPLKLKLENYFMPLQALVSRTLLELISLNIQKLSELSETVIQSGFGDKGQISSQYNKPNFNPEIEKMIFIPMKKK